jgi:hypothetical protein
MSGPTIVNDLRALRRAAPGDYNRRLNDAIDKILAGDGDLIDLALEAHALFSEQPTRTSLTAKGKAGHQRTDQVSIADCYSTAEEFREAMTASKANGKSGLLLTDDPGLHDVLAIVLRGIAKVDSRVSDKIRDDAGTNDLNQGEEEDGDDTEDGPFTVPPTAETVVRRRVYTPDELKTRAKQLKTVLNQFEQHIDVVAKSTEVPAANLPIQTVFMLKLMVYACCHVYQTTEGSADPLMKLKPVAGVERAATFVVKASTILSRLWRDTPQGSPVSRLYKNIGSGQMSDDLFYLTAITRWAMVRAYLEVEGDISLRELAKIIAAKATEIFKATLRLGTLDADAETTFVTKLDEALGFSAEQTAEVLRESRRFLSIK